MKKFKLKILLALIMVVSFSSLAIADIKTIRVVIEPLVGETDIEDNSKEIEVNVVPRGVTDLVVTDISMSPLTISTGTYVDVWVSLRNKGSDIAYNIRLNLYALGRKDENSEYRPL